MGWGRGSNRIPLLDAQGFGRNALVSREKVSNGSLSGYLSTIFGKAVAFCKPSLFILTGFFLLVENPND